MKKELIVELIQNDIVKCETEDGKFVYLPIEALPEGIQEGDILEKNLEYRILRDKTRRRKEFMDDKLNRLLNKKEENIK